MKNRLSDSAGHKTFAVAVGDIEHRVSIRRLPMRPLDNDTRYRVRLVRVTLTGETLSNTYRDIDISRAYNVYDQNVSRLAALVS